MARCKSAEICNVCKGIIPINQRSTKRKKCKACEMKQRLEGNRERSNTKERLKRKLQRLEDHNRFLKEYADTTNWMLNLSKISRNLNIPVSTLSDHAKRYESGEESHNFFLKEYANRDNWRVNLTKISRKIDIPVSTIWQYVKQFEAKR